MREEGRGKRGKATQPSCDEPNPRGTEGGEQKGNHGMEEWGQKRTKGRTEERKPLISLKGNYSPLFWRGVGGEALFKILFEFIFGAGF